MVIISGLCSHTQKFSENCIYALAVTRKSSTRAAAADTLDLHQVSNGVHRCVQVGAYGLEWTWFLSMLKWRSTTHTTVRCFWPVMREICDEFFIFQQGDVPAHRACRTIGLLKRDTCIHFIRCFATQQHRSEPDWLRNMGEMQQQILQVHDVDKLKQCWIDVWHHFKQSFIDDAVDE